MGFLSLRTLKSNAWSTSRRKASSSSCTSRVSPARSQQQRPEVYLRLTTPDLLVRKSALSYREHPEDWKSNNRLIPPSYLLTTPRTLAICTLKPSGERKPRTGPPAGASLLWRMRTPHAQPTRMFRAHPRHTSCTHVTCVVHWASWIFINILRMHISNCHRRNSGRNLRSRASCYRTCGCQVRLSINDLLDYSKTLP